MAADPKSSPFVEPLPATPSLEMQQKRAKELLRAASAGEPQALARVRALHPTPPAAGELTLADAQLVIARGYGFESWAAMKRKIQSLTLKPVERFLQALHVRDRDTVRALLEEHADVRAAVNAPIGPFDARPLAIVKTDLGLVDLLLSYGADLNLKSEWWAGGFGLLESNCTPEEAAPLIERGATVDVFAASHLGMFDRVLALVDADPSLVRARGGDGRTPLHCARTAEIARLLLDRGADPDARDVDHESTAAQHLVRDAPDVARLLVERGAWFDIFIAVGLREPALIARCLTDDPRALDHRTGQGLYRVAHDGRRAATVHEIGDRRGDIYRWVFDHNVSALDVARKLGDAAVVDRLMAAASPAQRLLAACAAADADAAHDVLRAHPSVVESLTPDGRRLVADKAYANDSSAVRLMVSLGFDPRVTGPDAGDALHWAAFHGNAEMAAALLASGAPVGGRDANYSGTPLTWCVYGALHGWHRGTGDYAATLRLLLAAGERPDPAHLPTGREDVDSVLREHLAASRPAE
jgi:ankyrin repeat protein